jgi:hypothetical protein
MVYWDNVFGDRNGVAASNYPEGHLFYFPDSISTRIQFEDVLVLLRLTSIEFHISPAYQQRIAVTHGHNARHI